MDYLAGYLFGLSNDPTKPLIFGEPDTPCQKTSNPVGGARFNRPTYGSEAGLIDSSGCHFLENREDKTTNRYPILYYKMKPVGLGPVTDDLFDRRIYVNAIEVRSTIGDSNEEMFKKLVKWWDIIAYPMHKTFFKNGKVFVGPYQDSLIIEHERRLRSGEVEGIEVVNGITQEEVEIDYNGQIKARIYAYLWGSNINIGLMSGKEFSNKYD